MKPQRIQSRETAEILRELLRRNAINEKQFQQNHHLGGSISGFLAYCDEGHLFLAGGTNESVHKWLEARLGAFGR